MPAPTRKSFLRLLQLGGSRVIPLVQEEVRDVFAPFHFDPEDPRREQRLLQRHGRNASAFVEFLAIDQGRTMSTDEHLSHLDLRS